MRRAHRLSAVRRLFEPPILFGALGLVAIAGCSHAAHCPPNGTPSHAPVPATTGTAQHDLEFVGPTEDGGQIQIRISERGSAEVLQTRGADGAQHLYRGWWRDLAGELGDRDSYLMESLDGSRIEPDASNWRRCEMVLDDVLYEPTGRFAMKFVMSSSELRMDLQRSFPTGPRQTVRRSVTTLTRVR